MIEPLTEGIFGSFLYGAAALILGGLLFEGGRRYVKRGGSNEFQGKIAVLPFFIMVLVLGYFLQNFEVIVEDIVAAVPPLTRAGIIVFGSMALLNYTVDNFRFDDKKSVAMYVVGLGLAAWPYV